MALDGVVEPMKCLVTITEAIVARALYEGT
jgi:hypothetical protein